MPNSKKTRLATLLEQARETLHLSQKEFLTHFGRFLKSKRTLSKQYYSGIENGRELPSLGLLMQIMDCTRSLGRQLDDPELTEWLLAWLEAKIQSETEDPEGAALPHRCLDLLKRLPATGLGRGSRSPLTSGHRVLTEFPAAFEPLTVVCGDRREPSPKNRSDIFAYSLSVTDLTFLPQLALPSDVQIKSDKLFVLMPQDYLREKFGRTHLLVLGSPAVNFAARVLNSGSIFSYDLSNEVSRWNTFKDNTKQLDDVRRLKIFQRLLEDPADPDPERAIEGASPDHEKQMLADANDLANEIRKLFGKDFQTVKAFLNSFRKPGFIDPADRTIHARHTRSDNDFAVISLARNPYSETGEHVAIIVGGIHGPGTAHGLSLLSSMRCRQAFQDRPLGGIVEIKLNPHQDWPSVFEKAVAEWQTRPYSVQDVYQHLREAAARIGPADRDRNEGAWYSRLSAEDLQIQLELIRKLAPNLDSAPRTEAAVAGPRPVNLETAVD